MPQCSRGLRLAVTTPIGGRVLTCPTVVSIEWVPGVTRYLQQKWKLGESILRLLLQAVLS